MEKNRLSDEAIGCAVLFFIGLASTAIYRSDLSNWWILTVPVISMFAVLTAVKVTGWIVPKGAGNEYEDESPKS